MKRQNSKIRQNKDDGTVLNDRRKPTSSQSKVEIGKAVTDDKQTGQLNLFSDKVEMPKGTDAGMVKTYFSTKPVAGLTSENTERINLLTTMGAIIGKLSIAFDKVMANKGAAGPDRQSIDAVKENWFSISTQLSHLLHTMEYRPGDIRRVWIPKASGGQRGLGIPNVIDRIVQEAVRIVIEPVYEPLFSVHSHGFRPGRGCHTAIAEAKQYVEDGREWVVDIDLKDFFNKVNHQRLMERLRRDIKDERITWLISRMLKVKTVMENGLKVANDEGVPQGGPLSPLLANIVLDELDKEFTRRGYSFVRYADDMNIYVRSERAGHRVMASVQSFIERRLRLTVNAEKSTVAKPEERHFLGFSLRRNAFDGEVETLLSERSWKRIKAKTKELIPRNYGGALSDCIKGLNSYLVGWMGFFQICSEAVLRSLQTIDAHNRRRLRAIQLKQWKRKRTIAKELIKRGAQAKYAWRSIYSKRNSLWALSHCSVVDRTLNNAYWSSRGVRYLKDLWLVKSRSISIRHSQGILFPEIGYKT